MSKIQIGFTFLVPAHPGSPGKMADERVYVTASMFIGPYWTTHLIVRHARFSTVIIWVYCSCVLWDNLTNLYDDVWLVYGQEQND